MNSAGSLGSAGAADPGGGGGTVADGGVIRLNTSVTNGGRGSWFYNVYNEFSPLNGTGHNGKFFFGSPMWVTWRFAFTVALTANAVFRQTIGNTAGNGGASTVLAAIGFGFGVVYKAAGTGSVLIYSHDGSLHTSAEIAVIDTSNAGIVHSITAASDGLGNLYFFVNGVYSGTVATGPTTESATARYINNDLVLNGADGVDNIVYFYPMRIVMLRL